MIHIYIPPITILATKLFEIIFESLLISSAADESHW